MLYALSVWGAAPTSTIGRLNVLHKKGIRHVCNSKYNAHTEPLFIKEDILKLEDLFKLQCNKIMYKKINKTLHSYHTSKLRTNFEITERHSKFQDDVKIIGQKNNFLKINSLNQNRIFLEYARICYFTRSVIFHIIDSMAFTLKAIE